MLITHRLQLRDLDDGDAAFVVLLLNDPAFLEFIGDRGVRTEADALGYIARIREGKVANGFGLHAVTLRASGTVVGLCGLVRRETLPHVDVGFAFLPAHRRQGYGREATRAVLEEAAALGITPLLAICSPRNAGSRALLEQVGFRFERMMVLPGQAGETCVYALR
ncbi:MAG: GNAT family N-acetyltransferase [Archangium sp.]|nr:GNAT family N-acetyltransferase [Archangium sp.]